eukprot:7339656-Pyramimonas_sp.AAC.1
MSSVASVSKAFSKSNNAAAKVDALRLGLLELVSPTQARAPRVARPVRAPNWRTATTTTKLYLNGGKGQPRDHLTQVRQDIQCAIMISC